MKKSLLLTMMLLSTALTMTAQDNTERLWYDSPAKIWLEALPIGNGRLGGMVYGGTQNDEVQLNEDTFWSGGPHDNNSTTSIDHLDEVRNLIFNDKDAEAAKLIDQQFIKGPHGMKYLTLGSLKMDHHCAARLLRPGCRQHHRHATGKRRTRKFRHQSHCPLCHVVRQEQGRHHGHHTRR